MSTFTQFAESAGVQAVNLNMDVLSLQIFEVVATVMNAVIDA